VQAFFETWSKSDGRAAFRAACELPDRFGIRGSNFMAFGFPQLFAREPAAALEVLAMVEARDAPELPAKFVVMGSQPPGSLEPLDPADVAARLNRVPGSQAGREFARFYAGFLKGKSTDTALAWAGSLAPAMAGTAYEAILGSVAVTAPQTALEIMSRLPSENLQALQGYNSLILTLAGKAPGETIAWLSEHMGLVPQSSEPTLVYEWLRKDTAAATDWLLTSGNPEDRHRRVLDAAASAPLALGLPAALAWVETLPDEARDTALTGIVGNPHRNNFPEILTYLSPQPDGTLTPAQLRVVETLALRMKDLPEPEYRQLHEWSLTPENASGRTFER
jgi:hypothetical protein